ncbi:MAG: hypothetical protein IKF18_04845 [Erysipelotrichaceae bacterium]|nr:hypothetical protein [Erysipelotrichaceae bacterium]MBR3167990.1 hypothetical protein [Erysipelotrichaceae bacterium]
MGNVLSKDRLLGIVKTVAVPAVVWILMELICRTQAGTSVVANSADVRTFFRNMVSTVAFALAISTNLNCGRMDLSLGAQMYVGTIFGGNIALALNLGGVGVLVLAMLIGGLCGLICGIVFVNLRILPMVLGLGMTLLFECICFSINNQQGVILYGKPGVEILSNSTFIIFVVIALVAVAALLFKYSRFGYRYRAIQGSQKLASDAGINIFSNCVFCYLFGGILVACAGVFTTMYSGSLAPVLGMSSNGYVFRNMFPMVLGAWIGSFSHNAQFGVAMGAICVNLLTLAMSKLGLPLNVQNVLVYSLFLLFIIYNTNKRKFAYNRAKRARIALAKQTKAARQPA